MLYAMLSGVTRERLSVPSRGDVRNTPLHSLKEELAMNYMYRISTKHCYMQA